MNKIFNELPWHDAIIHSVFIDRNSPGENDSICIKITWPTGENSLVFFQNCYSAILNLNFGIVAPESILSAECLEESDEIQYIREKWSKHGISINKLRQFRIKTNSTNGLIEIFSSDVEIKAD